MASSGLTVTLRGDVPAISKVIREVGESLQQHVVSDSPTQCGTPVCGQDLSSSGNGEIGD